ncbi:MAG: METTL5 family protein [Candidatus Methanomethylophilaceae archaeon]|jgi:putative methylase|nr:RNA methylase [Methanomassiliicoccales archaeon RumEn M2]MDD2532020.1 METTL5 family protein [Candidatus Methanomethylophilaceae archaeon]MDI9378682.1 METTL5 family protein [Candidatus Thermoplasmatota archaeon]MDD2778820.1 METTL5 family protein [Candidatus Methanomethylophilaceae archaeon]MDD3127931.1 METTL5 family protein [Candidatus Methanomethylophilaceae archaeon]
MRKKELEIALESLLGFDGPDPSLEQYPTPSFIASDVLFSAYAEGNVADKGITDLGCGPGIFSIGAWLLGAESVRGYDISPSAIAVARKNAERFGADIDLAVCDVRDVSGSTDTVFMNPPFGCQRKRADRPFLDKAMEIGKSIYSVHKAETLPFLTDYVSSAGREVVGCATYKYNIPHTFSFHSKTKQTIDVVVVNIR